MVGTKDSAGSDVPTCTYDQRLCCFTTSRCLDGTVPSLVSHPPSSLPSPRLQADYQSKAQLSPSLPSLDTECTASRSLERDVSTVVSERASRMAACSSRLISELNPKSASRYHTLGRKEDPLQMETEFCKSKTKFADCKQSTNSLTVRTIAETPPSDLGLCQTTPNASSPYDSMRHFRTPSAAEWVKFKSSVLTPSPSYHHTDELSFLRAGGGKVTPPLCGCGRRTKRKTVSTPGPNEGRAFFSCPRGRGSGGGSGCGYFKWEWQGSLMSDSSGGSPDLLSSEYD